jgi:hypothetical protein
MQYSVKSGHWSVFSDQPLKTKGSTMNCVGKKKNKEKFSPLRD